MRLYSRVRRFPPEAVTSRSDAEEDPRAAGLEASDVDAMWEAALSLYRTRLHPALALCVRRRGRVVLERAVGHLHGNAPEDAPGAEVPIRHDSLFNLFSASKAITAMLVHLYDERGLVHLDDPVAEYLPAFGRHGKQWVTLRHLLTHRAGIPATPVDGVDPALLCEPERIFALLCDTEPVSVPGRRLAYHALTGGYVIAAVLEQVTGRSLRQLLRADVLEPLGIAHLDYGVPAEAVAQVAVNAFTGPAAYPPYTWLLKRSLGLSITDAVRLSNDPRFITAVVPSGNIIGTAREACRFFECLLRGGELDGVRVFDRRTVRRAVAEQTFLEVDSFIGLPVRYGMGFMLGSRTFSIYGPSTERAFGHVGFTNVVTWADPERALSCALLTSGKPFVTLRQLRWLHLMRVISQRCARA